MRTTRISATLLSFMAMTLFFACEDRGSDSSSGLADERAADRAAEAPPEPEHASYGLNLADAVPVPIAVTRPDRPFPRSAIVGPSSLELLYGEDEGGDSFLVFGSEGEIDAEAAGSRGHRFDLRGPLEAKRGATAYRIEGKSLIAVSEESEAAIPAQRRWDSERTLVAGPVAFQDRILVATDGPSFVTLDRATLAFVSETRVDALVAGPMAVLTGPRLLAAFRADGGVGLYSLGVDGTAGGATERHADPAGGASAAPVPGGGQGDPVAALVEPSGSALAGIEKKTASLMGKESVSFPPVRLYGPQRRVEGPEAVLFRLDTDGKGGPMRVYLGEPGGPYLVAAFDAAGEFIKSNIDYSGAEGMLELRLEPNTAYFFSVALLGEAGAAEEPGEARFTIVPKK